MKTLVLSDIHSNIHALEAIWAKERDCDLVVCAGDLVDYGPYPREVLDWIKAYHVPCVQGNHDSWVVTCHQNGHTLETMSLEERAWVHHNASLLTEEDIEFLRQLPEAIILELDGIVYGLTHLYQGYDEIVSLYAYGRFCAGMFQETHINNLIVGHTHRQAVRILSDTVKWLNPGSVSYRRKDDPDQTAHYATISDGRISLRRLAYDIAPVYRATCQLSLKESEMSASERFFGPRTPKPLAVDE